MIARLCGTIAFAIAAASTLTGAGQPGAGLAIPTAFSAARHVERLDGAGYLGDRWILRSRRGDAMVELVVLLLPQARFSTSVAPLSYAAPARQLFRGAPCRNAAVVTNGGFFWRHASGPRPLGLVRVDGRTLSRPSGRRYGGFLTSDGGRLALLPRGSRSVAVRAEDAIESSPMIVRAGLSDMKSDDGVRFDRVAIGLTADDHAVVVGAFARDQETVTLSEIGALARSAVQLRGKRLETLLALDGGPSAHVYLPASRRLFGFAGSIYVPNVICMVPR